MFLSDLQSKKKVSFFTALCMICSMAEILIPKPSFIKIGFSNIPVMLALANGFSAGEYFTLVILRIIFQGLLNGTVFSYAFVMSASAGITSSVAMYIVHKIPGISYIGLSEIGAFCSNLVQLYVAHFFLGNGVYYLAPAVLGIGVVTSFILGCLTPAVYRKTDIEKKYEKYCNMMAQTDDVKADDKGIHLLKIIVSSIMLAVTFFTENTTVAFTVFMVFLSGCIFSKKRANFYMIAAVIIQAVLLALIMPLGRELFTVMNWSITEGAIKIGLHRAFVLLSSVYFSRFVIPDRNKLSFKTDSLLFLVLFFFRKLSESESIENN